jgi:prophage maintenance system killer protein
MYENISLKDIVRTNQEIGETGELQNRSSLEYALSTVKQRRSWLHELSFLVRSLLVDHVFSEGNKRTALALMLTYFEDRNMEYDRQKVVEAVYNISRKNINDINKISRMIKNATIR